MLTQELETLSQSDISAQDSSVYRYCLQQSNFFRKGQNSDAGKSDVLLVAETKKIRQLQKKVDVYTFKNQYQSMQLQTYQAENRRYKFAFQAIILPLFIILLLQQLYSFIIN